MKTRVIDLSGQCCFSFQNGRGFSLCTNLSGLEEGFCVQNKFLSQTLGSDPSSVTH